MSHFEVTDCYMGHTGGTKFYQVVVLLNHAANKGIVINRYGKNGTTRQMDCNVFDSVPAARAAGAKLIAQKTKRGYASSIGAGSRHSTQRCEKPTDIDKFMLSGPTSAGQWERIVKAYRGLLDEAGFTQEIAASSDPIDEIVESVAEEVESGGNHEWGTW